ncbi:hypothetical protein [Streptomyces sp. TRM75563]|uniref:hypothetical protein n=1 Tax=Streptomyces sp. TRM75563 TaxID=2817418 RepID=UPI001F607317|nr:hypothetical protein [Streptomyces sp. TRM75563]MCI4042343.1 hypothetical protein [Streptomyces sp. TRM75563]
MFASEDVGDVKTYVRVLGILGGRLPVIAWLIRTAVIILVGLAIREFLDDSPAPPADSRPHAATR